MQREIRHAGQIVPNLLNPNQLEERNEGRFRSSEVFLALMTWQMVVTLKRIGSTWGKVSLGVRGKFTF